MTMDENWDLPPELADGLRRDKAALDREFEQLKEKVWQRIIAARPELEHAVLEWPDPSWWRRLWNWIRRN